jgi:MFS family permease
MGALRCCGQLLLKRAGPSYSASSYAIPARTVLESPIVGALSDRFGRKLILMVSLAATTICYAVIAAALDVVRFSLLCARSFLAGLSEVNTVAAQGAITGVIRAAGRNRYFGYIIERAWELVNRRNSFSLQYLVKASALVREHWDEAMP